MTNNQKAGAALAMATMAFVGAAVAANVYPLAFVAVGVAALIVTAFHFDPSAFEVY
ncbi:hypothetical protein [Limoniibacter endophyticus]|uniref:Uncharacterized protein n=1 Tax=Limoniibacter endophyticus TaxID=1565040 RepID=A0A8J3GFB6_9HYPH|nr:hypothetical protein [Limoniibacter endophyticus]GHC61766.1 hypothetical protein GCM10010136_02520 [Limoniibacter endophyticus]